MYFLRLLSLALLLSFGAFDTHAQEQTEPLQSTELLRKKPSRNPDLEGLVLTYQMDFLRGLPEGGIAVNQLRSGGFSFMFYWNQRFGKSNFSYAAGLGLSSRNYFNNLRNWSDGTVWADSLNVDKNKYVFTTYELVPVELRFSSRPTAKLKSFKVSTGLSVGYTAAIGSKTVRGRLIEKYKGTSDLLDLDPLRLGIVARVGYHRLGLSLYYGLNDWFNTNQVNAKPMSVGVTLML